MKSIYTEERLHTKIWSRPKPLNWTVYSLRVSHYNDKGHAEEAQPIFVDLTNEL